MALRTAGKGLFWSHIEASRYVERSVYIMDTSPVARLDPCHFRQCSTGLPTSRWQFTSPLTIAVQLYRARLQSMSASQGYYQLVRIACSAASAPGASAAGGCAAAASAASAAERRQGKGPPCCTRRLAASCSALMRNSSSSSSASSSTSSRRRSPDRRPDRHESGLSDNLAHSLAFHDNDANVFQ